LKTESPITCSSVERDTLCINTIRFLSVDAVEKANSGHPGLPMGAARKEDQRPEGRNYSIKVSGPN
jgi:hypothetical protein